MASISVPCPKTVLIDNTYSLGSRGSYGYCLEKENCFDVEGTHCFDILKGGEVMREERGEEGCCQGLIVRETRRN